MYYFYLDTMELPVTPSKVTVKIKNQNETVNLINEGEVNLLKQPGLTQIAFDFLLPAHPYPFSNNSLGVSAVLSHLESLKVEKAVFSLIISRMTPEGMLLHDTNMKVTLEDYTIKDDAAEGMDTIVSASFLQYREWGAKTVKIKQGNTTANLVSGGNASSEKQPAQSYRVKEGDTLYNICQVQLGDGEKYRDVAKKNGIGNPNNITVGQVIAF